MPANTPLTVEVSFDLICPWCLIGKRNLETAIAQLRSEQPGLEVLVEWRSCPLIPGTPLEGLPYRAFYLARLGSPEAVAARQAQVRSAARQAGLALALTDIETFPNTLLAHGLVGYARQEYGACAASALVEQLFTRYFLQAADIGDPRVLRAACQDCGITLPGPPGAPLRHDLPWLPPVPAAQDPLHRGGTGVPLFVFDGALAVSGAQPPSVLLQAMRQALAQRMATAA
jgi:predicted DsbA family dithiol-disulfide isomerase